LRHFLAGIAPHLHKSVGKFLKRVLLELQKT